MTSPGRLATFPTTSTEGRLLAAGRAEFPDDGATRRAAARLGLSAVTVGTAVAAATVTATKASASAATAGTATLLPVGSSSLLTITFFKATVIGAAIGVGTLGTADLVFRHRTHEPTSAAPSASVAAPVTASPPVLPARLAPSPSNIPLEPAVPSTVPARPCRHSGRAPASELANTADGYLPKVSEQIATIVPTADFELQARRRNAAQDKKTHLGGEVESLDRARAAVSRGDAAAALRELDDFAHHQPYRLLANEVMLVRIEALLAMGQRMEAAAIARQLLQSGAPAPQRARLESLVRSQ